MMLDEQENYVDSDSSDNEAKHSKLVNSISQLDSTQRVKPASRKEVISEVSEYNLSKTKKDLVNVKELAQVLGSKPNHVSIHKKFKKVISKSKTLPKPLEKPMEEKFKRTIGFEKVKKQVKRWDAIVARNALNDHMVFPLQDNSMKMQQSSDFFKQFQSNTPLEEEISKVLKKEKEPSENEKEEIDNYPLTLEEMIQKRKEMAQLRAKLSYKEAKARYQSKIKSKKFHRILKREKLKEQLKNFEILQKTDPEAALKKLAELDKTRVKERASLRHRNTGQWAKNMSVRAKYDVESRKILADQLKLSRELTQKAQMLESSDEEEVNEQDENLENKISKGPIVEKGNPWSLQVSEEVKDFISCHKKFWENQSRSIDEDENNKENKIKPSKENETETNLISGKVIIDTEFKSLPVNTNEKNTTIKKCLEPIKEEKTNGKINKVKDISPISKQHSKKISNSPKIDVINSIDESEKILTVRPTAGVWIITPISKETIEMPKLIKEKKKKGENANLKKIPESVGKKRKAENEKIIKMTELVKKKRKAENLNALFNELEEKMMEKAVKKVKKINKNLKNLEKRKKKNKKKKKEEEEDFDLSLKSFKTIEKPDLDLELIEGDNNEATEKNNDFNTIITTMDYTKNPLIEIDPKNFIKVKPKQLGTYVPENITEGEDDIDNEMKQRQAIEEAFCDDDVIAEFEEEKKEENKKREVEISNSLPGWGEWGGVGLKPNPKKKKHFFVSKLPPRKDKGKVDIIINENENPNIRQHMVKEVPHPFKSVEAFEANIRAPVGRDWVPETAHRKIIQKQIETKLGAIIEPMSEDQIVKTEKTPRCPFQGKNKEKQKTM